MTLDIYAEVRLADNRYVTRFFLAPAGLGMANAKAQRVGRFRKTREGARRALVAELDRERRA